MIWERKHVCYIASVCKAVSENAALDAKCRSAFAVLYGMASRLAKGPVDLAARRADSVVTALCDVCHASGLRACEGRGSWQDDCPMLAEAFRNEGKTAL